MSNATINANGRPSRRSLLAAGPAVAILSTVKAAVAESVDPIFAAMNAARRAKSAHEEVRKSIRALRHQHPKLDLFEFTAKADGDSQKVSTIQHLNDWLDRQGPAHRVYGKRVFAEAAARVLGIEEPTVADPAPEALAAWDKERAAVVAEFDRARRAYDEGQEEVGLPRLYADSDKAADASDAAEAALLSTVPTTPAGGVALMRYCLEAMDRYGDYVEVMPAMENALAAMEGARAA